MNFILCKTRVNTDFNKVKSSFDNERSLQHFFETCSAGSVKIKGTISPFENNAFFSGKAKYQIEIKDHPLELEVHIMQTTEETEYCYDVFLKLKGESPLYNDKASEFRQLLDSSLNTLRSHFNGTWIIGDDELHYSILK